MSIDQLCNEEIYLVRGGQQSGPYKATFQKGKFTIFDGTLVVDSGDLIDRPLPNGRAERYTITNVHFTHKFHSIPAHVELEVQKQGAQVPFSKAKTVNINISGSHGFQIGDHNVQNIVDSFKQVIERIEQGPGTPAEKAEAKSRLKTFLEHPLTAAIVGGAAGALLPLL